MVRSNLIFRHVVRIGANDGGAGILLLRSVHAAIGGDEVVGVHGAPGEVRVMKLEDVFLACRQRRRVRPGAIGRVRRGPA